MLLKFIKSIKPFVYKIEKGIIYKAKDGYSLGLLTPEVQKLLEASKSKIKK